ncbi:DoxX family protein [Lapillicoccus sp.]|uniref:DoxX family protein n=1 Tax=Lapillicoccus sp. TaxID=1909287 RepID=UPI003982D73D
MTVVRRIARPLLAAVFVVAGLDAVRHPGGKANVASPLLDKLGPMLGLPDDKEMLVRANGAAQLVGGALLATGRLPRVGGLLIAGSLIPTTLAGHAFWEKSDPAERAKQRTQFLKNLGLLGGALLASVDTDGKPGLVWRAQNAGRVTRREARHAAKTARREARLAQKQAHITVQDALN